MVAMSSDFRNLTQMSGNLSLSMAAAVDRVIQQQAPISKETSDAVNAVSDLLHNYGHLDSNESIRTDPRSVSASSSTYESDGHPDLLAALWSLVDRPVGKNVRHTRRSVSVTTAAGTVVTQVETSAEYVSRPLTREEFIYLEQQARLKGRKVRPGEHEYLLRPELR